MESSTGRKGNEVNISENEWKDKRFGGMSVWIGMSIKQSIGLMVSVSIRAKTFAIMMVGAGI